jgi:uncharacterized membrane protein
MNMISSSLIGKGDDWGNMAVLAVTATAAQTLGNTTKVGQLLGAPVTAMACAFVLGSVGILPPGGSSGASLLQKVSLQLATPLLLLSADLRGCASKCGPLLQAFFLAAMGTILASVVGILSFGAPLKTALGADGIKIAAALMAKNVGGGINYIAVCKTLNASPNAIAAGLCVDNIFALIYFPITSALASGRPDLDDDENSTSNSKVTPPETTESPPKNSMDGVQQVSMLLSLAMLAIWGGDMLSKWWVGGLSASLPCCTLLTVAGSLVIPSKLSKQLQIPAQTLGTVLLYLFFATAGAPGLAIAESVRASFVPLGAFLTTLYGIHGLFLWTMRQIWPSGKEGGAVAPQRLLVASSAAIGGPATAAALAQANGWTSLLAPSLLVGNLGYAIATFCGIAFHAYFLNRF